MLFNYLMDQFGPSGDKVDKASMAEWPQSSSISTPRSSSLFSRGRQAAKETVQIFFGLKKHKKVH